MLVTLTPVVTVGLYTANDCVGGKLLLPNAVESNGDISLLQSFTIIDLGMQNAAMSIYLFKEDPITGTYSNDAELDLDDMDLKRCIGCFNVNGGDYLSAKDNSVACITNLGILCNAASRSRMLWALMKTTGTPTYTSVNDLKLIFGFRLDI